MNPMFGPFLFVGVFALVVGLLVYLHMLSGQHRGAGWVLVSGLAITAVAWSIAFSEFHGRSLL